MQLDVDGLGAGQDRVGAVVLVEGREDGYLVAWVQGREHRAHHGLGAAAGDHKLRAWVDVKPGVALELGRQRLAGVLRAPGDGVLVRAGGRHLGQALGDGLGRIEVREAL